MGRTLAAGGGWQPPPRKWHSRVCDYNSDLWQYLVIYVLNLTTSLLLLIYCCRRISPSKRPLSRRQIILCALALFVFPPLPVAYFIFLGWHDLDFLFKQKWRTQSQHFLLSALIGMPAQRSDGTLVHLSKVDSDNYRNLTCIRYEYSRRWLVRLFALVIVGFICLNIMPSSYPWSKSYIGTQLVLMQISGDALLIMAALIFIANCRWELGDASQLQYRDEPETDETDTAVADGPTSTEETPILAVESEVDDNEEPPEEPPLESVHKKSVFRKARNLYDKSWRSMELAVLIFVFVSSNTGGYYYQRHDPDIGVLLGEAPVNTLTAIFWTGGDGSDLRTLREYLTIVVGVLWGVFAGIPLILALAFFLITYMWRSRPWMDWTMSKLTFWRKWFILPAILIQLILFHFVFTWVRVGLAFAMPTQDCDFNQWSQETRWDFCSACGSEW